jgi:hypothetical protein
MDARGVVEMYKGKTSAYDFMMVLTMKCSYLLFGRKHVCYLEGY